MEMWSFATIGFGRFFFESCRQAGIGGQMEVGSGLGHDARRTRPADHMEKWPIHRRSPCFFFQIEFQTRL